jgi:hypothetical protein
MFLGWLQIFLSLKLSIIYHSAGEKTPVFVYKSSIYS